MTKRSDKTGDPGTKAGSRSPQLHANGPRRDALGVAAVAVRRSKNSLVSRLVSSLFRSDLRARPPTASHIVSDP